MTPKPRGFVSKFNTTRKLRPVPGRKSPHQSLAPRRSFAGQRQQPKIYGRIGNMEVRLAHTRSDLKRAQRLRYHVFYEEMAAIPDALATMSRRDEDPFDSICDHLLVLDHGPAAKVSPWPRRPRVVGTYRILRQDVAELHDGFYTQGEYNISPMLEKSGEDCRFMELGRSCVLKPYRNRRTVELLWQGIWSYAREHGVDAMLGCASFEGTDPRRHADALSFLHHNSMAPERWRVKAHDHVRVDMNMKRPGEFTTRDALRAMPPLIKGYLRLGAYVGDGAVIDHQFGTTDVFIILPVEAINERYFTHFGAPDEFSETRKYPGQLN